MHYCERGTMATRLERKGIIAEQRKSQILRAFEAFQKGQGHDVTGIRF